MKGVGLTALETEVLYYVTEVKKCVTIVFIRSPSSSLCQHRIVLSNTFLSDFSHTPLLLLNINPQVFPFCCTALILTGSSTLTL